MHCLLVSFLLAARFAAAIQFTSPGGGESFAQGEEVTVEWTSVDTDPSSFSLYLWNFAVFPPFYELLVFDTSTAAGSTTVTLPCDVVASDQYQLSAINGTNVYVIYAQTEVFSVTDGDCVAPTGATSTPGVVTVTVTAEVTCGYNGTIVTTAKPSYPSSSVFYSPTPTFSIVTVSHGVAVKISWHLLGLCMALVGAKLL